MEGNKNLKYDMKFWITLILIVMILTLYYLTGMGRNLDNTQTGYEILRNMLFNNSWGRTNG